MGYSSFLKKFFFFLGFIFVVGDSSFAHFKFCGPLELYEILTKKIFHPERKYGFKNHIKPVIDLDREVFVRVLRDLNTLDFFQLNLGVNNIQQKLTIFSLGVDIFLEGSDLNTLKLIAHKKSKKWGAFQIPEFRWEIDASHPLFIKFTEQNQYSRLKAQYFFEILKNEIAQAYLEHFKEALAAYKLVLEARLPIQRNGFTFERYVRHSASLTKNGSLFSHFYFEGSYQFANGNKGKFKISFEDAREGFMSIMISGKKDFQNLPIGKSTEKYDGFRVYTLKGKYFQYHSFLVDSGGKGISFEELLKSGELEPEYSGDLDR